MGSADKSGKRLLGCYEYLKGLLLIPQAPAANMWGVPIHQEDMAVTLLVHLKSLLLIPLAPATNTVSACY